VLGGIQPEPIQRIARESSDDGLLQRFMFCVADRQGEGEDRAPNSDALRRYECLFWTLASLHPPVLQGSELSDVSDRVQVVVLHAEAHHYRQAINDLGRAMAAMPDTSSRLKAALGKWPGLFARLALTFHLIEIADARARNTPHPASTVVSEATARRVASYMRDVLLPHLLRAEETMFSTAQTSHARWIAGYILAKKLTRITDRDIVQAYGALRSPECRRERLEVMEGLVTMAWVRPEEQINPSRPTAAWLVNPAVLTVFAARAERERIARSKAREQLTKSVTRSLARRQTG
jgi:hypothetical protein